MRSPIWGREDFSTSAALTTTNTLYALILVEHDGLSGAILDHALGDGDSSLLYARLRERGIPFLIYSGFDAVGGASAGAPHISKPAAPGELVAAMEKLIRERGSELRLWAVESK